MTHDKPMQPGDGYCELRIIAPRPALTRGLEYARVGGPVYCRVHVVPVIKESKGVAA